MCVWDGIMEYNQRCTCEREVEVDNEVHSLKVDASTNAIVLCIVCIVCIGGRVCIVCI